MRRQIGFGLIIFIALLLFLPFAVLAEGDQCVACHTSGRALINSVREIEAEIPEEPMESTESVGEG